MKLNIRKSITAVLSTAVVVAGAIVSGVSEAKAQSAEIRVNSYYSAVAAGMRAIGEYSYAVDVLSDVGEQAYVLTQGAKICTGIFPHGTTPRQLFRDTIADGYSLNVAGDLLVMSTAAALTLCPEYAWMVDSTNTQQTTYYTPLTTTANGQWVTLTASDPNSQINVRSTPSLSASSPSYGLVGDRAWSTRVERHDGYNWYFVGFPNSGVTGWVRGDFVDAD